MSDVGPGENVINYRQYKWTSYVGNLKDCTSHHGQPQSNVLYIVNIKKFICHHRWQAETISNGIMNQLQWSCAVHGDFQLSCV